MRFHKHTAWKKEATQGLFLGMIWQQEEPRGLASKQRHPSQPPDRSLREHPSLSYPVQNQTDCPDPPSRSSPREIQGLQVERQEGNRTGQQQSPLRWSVRRAPLQSPLGWEHSPLRKPPPNSSCPPRPAGFPGQLSSLRIPASQL